MGLFEMKEEKASESNKDRLKFYLFWFLISILFLIIGFFLIFYSLNIPIGISLLLIGVFTLIIPFLSKKVGYYIIFILAFLFGLFLIITIPILAVGSLKGIISETDLVTSGEKIRFAFILGICFTFLFILGLILVKRCILQIYFLAKTGKAADIDIILSSSTSKAREDIRNLSWATILMGFLHIALPNLLIAWWGVVLIIFGIIYMVYPAPKMYIVDGFIVLAVGLINLSNSIPQNIIWLIAFGLFQLTYGVNEIRRFRRYLSMEKDDKALATEMEQFEY